MTDYKPVPLERGWCFDTNWVLSSGEAGVMKRAPYPGQPTLALWRYVSLGDPSPNDITTLERDNILNAGWLLGLVQHVQYPSWAASPASGMAHGAHAASHAQLIGYPPGCHLGLDMEGLGNAGAPVMGYVVAWADAVHAAGYRVLMYVGYQDGLSAAQHKALQDGGYVDAWWSDFGPRTLPDGCAWAMKQHVQTTIAGIQVDPDEVLIAGAIAVMGIDDGDPVTKDETPDAKSINTRDTDPAPSNPPEAA